MELLSSINNNNNRDQGGEEEEADDDLKVGAVELVFLDQEMAMEHQQTWGHDPAKYSEQLTVPYSTKEKLCDAHIQSFMIFQMFRDKVIIP